MTYKSVVVNYKVGSIKDKTADISAAVSSIYYLCFHMSNRNFMFELSNSFDDILMLHQ